MLLVRRLLSTDSLQLFFHLFSNPSDISFTETMKKALEKKDLDLAAMQKTAEQKTALADQKLASVGQLEEENTKLKTALDEANREATRLKKDKETLTDKLEGATRKRNELEAYLGSLAAKLFLMLEGTFSCPIELSSSIR